MPKYIGTVTDKTFKEAIRDLDISMEEKVHMLHDIKGFPDLSVSHYQLKRFYSDEHYIEYLDPT